MHICSAVIGFPGVHVFDAYVPPEASQSFLALIFARPAEAPAVGDEPAGEDAQPASGAISPRTSPIERKRRSFMERLLSDGQAARAMRDRHTLPPRRARFKRAHTARLRPRARRGDGRADRE